MQDRVAAAAPGAGCDTSSGTPGLTSGPESGTAGPGRRAARDRRPQVHAEDPELYSYRRDGRTGRFAGLIWLAS